MLKSQKEKKVNRNGELCISSTPSLTSAWRGFAASPSNYYFIMSGSAKKSLSAISRMVTGLQKDFLTIHYTNVIKLKTKIKLLFTDQTRSRYENLRRRYSLFVCLRVPVQIDIHGVSFPRQFFSVKPDLVR